MSATSDNRLTRNKQDGMIAGVCAGIATRYGYDTGLVRLVAVLLTVVSLGLGGVVLYAAAWILIPAADTAPPASMGERRRELTGEVTAAAGRATEAARIAASHARQAADEIAAVARVVRPDTSASTDSAPHTEPGVSTTPPAAAADPGIVMTDAGEVDPPAGGPQQT